MDDTVEAEFYYIHLNWPGGAPKMPCLLAALLGENPSIF